MVDQIWLHTTIPEEDYIVFAWFDKSPIYVIVNILICRQADKNIIMNKYVHTFPSELTIIYYNYKTVCI